MIELALLIVAILVLINSELWVKGYWDKNEE